MFCGERRRKDGSYVGASLSWDCQLVSCCIFKSLTAEMPLNEPEITRTLNGFLVHCVQ